MSNNLDPWELPSPAEEPTHETAPTPTAQSGSNRGAMWTLLVILVVMIVAMGAALAYFFLSSEDSNVAEGPSASATKKTVTSTATKTATVSKSAKDRCAPSMFSDRKATNADSRFDEVVVDYCDGKWAKWGVYGTGAVKCRDVGWFRVEYV